MLFGSRDIDNLLQLNGYAIENVQDCECSGRLIAWDNDCIKNIKRRIRKTSGASEVRRKFKRAKKQNRRQS